MRPHLLMQRRVVPNAPWKLTVRVALSGLAFLTQLHHRLDAGCAERPLHLLTQIRRVCTTNQMERAWCVHTLALRRPNSTDRLRSCGRQVVSDERNDRRRLSHELGSGLGLSGLCR